MMTRQSNKTEVDETVVDKALEDAGMFEANLPLEEKRDMYQALQESKFKQVAEKTQRLSLNPQNNSERNSQTCSSRDQESTVKDRKLSQHTVADVTEVSTSDVSRHMFPGSKEEERRPGPNSSSARKSAGSGRGRAVPTKSVKYPPLTLSGPGQNRSSHPGSPQNRPSSPDFGSPDLFGDAVKNNTPNPLSQSPLCSPVCPENIQSASPVASKPAPDVDVDVDDCLEDENVDVEDCEGPKGGSLRVASNQHQIISSTTEISAESPSSSQDVEEDDEDFVKEPTHTMQIGQKCVPLSPFVFMVKPLPSGTSLPGFEEIDKIKGDKAEWLKQAKALVAMQKEAYWDKLLTEKWGPPIQDSGYNKKTLFKQVVPKYSKLFASTSEKSGATSVRTERQAKFQANARIQEVMADEGPDLEFHSLRRSRQREVKREDQAGGKQASAWGIVKSDDDDVQCLEEQPSEGDGSPIWESTRGQERRIPVGSDTEFAPESPPVSGSRDPYDFDDEMWTPAGNKNKKNNKRCGKSIQGDVEVEGRTSQRGRGSSAVASGHRGKNTKLRLQNKSISHPSEHATSSNNPRNKVGPPEYSEDDTVAKNNANSENRAWSNLNRGEAEVASDISAKKFYNQRVSQPRNTQPRRNSRENQRTVDFPPSPGTSRQHDEEAVIETMPCPICGKSFPQKQIEVHADSCFEYGDESAVGE